MAYLGAAVSLCRLLNKRGSPEGRIERRPAITFSAWCAGVLLVRLCVNAAFIRRAFLHGLTENAETFLSVLVLHSMASAFVVTLFLLQTGNGPGRRYGRLLLTPVPKRVRAAAEVLTLFTGPFILPAVALMLPVVFPLTVMPDTGLTIPALGILFIATMCAALGFRSLGANLPGGLSRGVLPLLLIMLLMYANPEYRILESGVGVWFSFGFYRLPEPGSLCTPASRAFLITATGVMAISVLFCGACLWKGGAARIRAAGLRPWRFRRSAGGMSPFRKDILSVAAFPGGPVWMLCSLAGGVYLFSRYTGGLVPVLVVTFAALVPVFRMQVRLLGEGGHTSPRYVWSSFSLAKLFTARLKAAALCSAVYLLPLVPAAIRAGVAGQWTAAAVLIIYGSTALGLTASLLWPEGSRLSFLSLLVPGITGGIVLIILTILTEPAGRIFTCGIMSALAVFTILFLILRAGMLSEAEKDDVFLHAL